MDLPLMRKYTTPQPLHNSQALMHTTCHIQSYVCHSALKVGAAIGHDGQDQETIGDLGRLVFGFGPGHFLASALIIRFVLSDA
jgi:hypothetical protein